MAKGTRSHGLCAPISIIQIKSQTVLGGNVQCSLYTFLSTPVLLEVNNSIQITWLEWNFQKLPTHLPKYIQICIYIYAHMYLTTHICIYLSSCYAMKSYINMFLNGIYCIMLMHIGNIVEEVIEYSRSPAVYICRLSKTIWSLKPYEIEIHMFLKKLHRRYYHWLCAYSLLFYSKLMVGNNRVGNVLGG